MCVCVCVCVCMCCQVVGTAFTFKGAECTDVLVGSDFRFDLLVDDLVLGLDKASHRPIGEFINLVYVAVTRAMERLYLSDAAMAYYQRLREHAGFPPYQIPSEGAPSASGSAHARDGNALPNFERVTVRGAHTALSKSEARKLREEFETSWGLFAAEFGGKKKRISDHTVIPWPNGPRGNEFAVHPKGSAKEAEEIAKSQVSILIWCCVQPFIHSLLLWLELLIKISSIHARSLLPCCLHSQTHSFTNSRTHVHKSTGEEVSS